jgi:penicillin-binding protein 2
VVRSRKLRLDVIGVVAVALFATLFARLWYLQVLETQELRADAAVLQRRTIVEPAPRGRILDARGRVLVDNRLGYAIVVDRDVLAALDAPQRRTVLDLLAARIAAYEPTVDLTVIEQRLASEQVSPFVPVPVAEDVPEELALAVIERQEEFLGAVSVDARSIRTYPFGQLAAHVLGYIGAINEREFAQVSGSDEQYQLTDDIGKTGVELTYETALRGQPGERVVEVDRQGNVVRELDYRPPVPGHDVVLTLDAAVQAVAETALREALAAARERPDSDGTEQPAPAGSVVVLDPTDGAVLAMASFPTYNPALFTDGIDDVEWASLNDPVNHLPLFNRAIQGQYAPGSTFKLITAYAGLAAGAITPETTLDDRGTFRVPNCSGGTCTFNNSGRRAWGRVDLRRAIAVSSDVYFYDLGARFWRERNLFGDAIQDAARVFGLGADTGIPLPDERAGWIPTPENKAQRNAENPTAFPYGEWYTGDNVNLAIGQGDVLTTPLQLTNAYAAVANGGRLLTPQVVREVRTREGEVISTTATDEIRTIRLEPAWRDALMDGFVGATEDGDGTASATFADFPGWTIAGKTGTAQVNGKADTALFVGMGPAEAPRYVAGAVLEESGFGGVAAAPLVRRILEAVADPARAPNVVADAAAAEGFRLTTGLPAAAPASAGTRG